MQNKEVRAQWLLYIMSVLAFRYSVFYWHIVFMYLIMLAKNIAVLCFL
jgi:hypothetical protein